MFNWFESLTRYQYSILIPPENIRKTIKVVRNGKVINVVNSFLSKDIDP